MSVSVSFRSAFYPHIRSTLLVVAYVCQAFAYFLLGRWSERWLGVLLPNNLKYIPFQFKFGQYAADAYHLQFCQLGANVFGGTCGLGVLRYF